MDAVTRSTRSAFVIRLSLDGRRSFARRSDDRATHGLDVRS
jgi:hypothetical protein